MTAICLPIDAVAGSPAFPAAEHRVAMSALMAGRTDRPLGAVSGVRPGSEPTVTATSSQATVTPFVAIVDPGTALTVGPYLVAFTDNTVVDIDPADSVNPRVDRLDVQVPDDPAGASPLAPVIVYTAGVPGSLVAPAAPARSMPLATIGVPKSGGGAPVVVTAYPHAAAAGGVLPVSDETVYPANPYVGQVVYNIATGEIRRWTGTDWRLPKGCANPGSASGTANATGDAVVTHGLPFTPSRVLVQSTIAGIGTQAALPLAVTSITATHFTVRLLSGNGSGNSTPAGNVEFYLSTASSLPYAFDWVAYE